jgi:ParB family chromosome partitioning protein
MANGLGRGLSSLIPPKQNTFSASARVAASDPDLQGATTQEIIEIPLDSIVPNPMQPRMHFDEKALEELAKSIESHGLLEPVIVTPGDDESGYQLVAGERRFRAHQLLGKAAIPSIIRTSSDLERLELALIENIQREDLNPIEKASSYAKLLDEFGLTQAQASIKLGIARSSLANALRLLDLPSVIQIGLAKQKITEGQAKVLLGLDSEKAQLELYQQILKKPQMTVREVTSQARRKSKSGGGSAVALNHELKSVESQLQEQFGTKVNIQPARSGGAKIVIEAYSQEELKALIKKLRD